MNSGVKDPHGAAVRFGRRFVWANSCPSHSSPLVPEHICITPFAYWRQKEWQNPPVTAIPHSPCDDRGVWLLSCTQAFKGKRETTSVGIATLLQDRCFAHTGVVPLILLLEGGRTQEWFSLWDIIFSENLLSSCSQLIAGLDPGDRTKRVIGGK